VKFLKLYYIHGQWKESTSGSYNIIACSPEEAKSQVLRDNVLSPSLSCSTGTDISKMYQKNISCPVCGCVEFSTTEYWSQENVYTITKEDEYLEFNRMISQNDNNIGDAGENGFSCVDCGEYYDSIEDIKKRNKS